MALRSASAAGSENTTPASARRSAASVGPEAGHQGVVGGAAGSHHLAGHDVGVDDQRAPLGQQRRDRGLPGSDPPRETDHEHRRATVSSASSASTPAATEGTPGCSRRDPEDRLDAARAQGKRATKALAERVGDWPPNAPGSLNAWLLLVTTKEPVWRDPMVHVAGPPADPRRRPTRASTTPTPWASGPRSASGRSSCSASRQPRWAATEALALTTLLPAGGQPDRVARAVEAFEPRVVLFLDEPSWAGSLGLFDVVELVPHYITDPHRPKQVYEGFWAQRRDGVVVGKSPQHPATHNLYRADDIMGYLRSAPIRPSGPPDGQ